MRLEKEAVEQIRACLTQAGVMMKKAMDIASENDDNTVMEESIAINNAIEILNVAILERGDHVSITEEHELYGDGEGLECSSEESTESDCDGDCSNCKEATDEVKLAVILDDLLKCVDSIKRQGENK